MNDFKREDIISSLEYRWRISQAKIYVLISAITFFAVAAIMIPLMLTDMGLDTVALVMLAVFVVSCLPFCSFALFSYLKARRFLSRYSEMRAYITVLDRPETSLSYRGAVYYKVTLSEEGRTFTTVTNPYFSSAALSKITLDDYNNKRVCGLYDPQKDKFYIVHTL